MAEKLGEALLELKTDLNKFKGEMGSANKAAQQSMSKMEARAAKFSKLMQSVAAFGGAVLAVRKLINIGKDLVKTYGIQETAETALRSAIVATGKEYSISTDALIDYAGELQQATTYGDEATISAMALLQSLGDLTEEGLKKLMPLIQDMATGMGMDLQMAASLVAKTLGSTTNSLTRYGIVIDATAPKQEKLAALAEAMQAKFGGMSEALAVTGTGALQQFQNAIGDLKEQGGKMLLEFLTPSIRNLTEFVTRTTAAIAETQKLKKIAEELAEGKKIETVDEIALLSKQIQDAERAYEGMGASAEAYAEFVGEGTGATEREIKVMKRRLAALSEIARWEAIGVEAKRKGDAEAAAAAEKEAKRLQELADWVKMVNDEYDKTEQGQRDILLAQIAKWEYELSRANVYKPQIEKILDMLYEQRDAEGEVGEAAEDATEGIDEFGRVVQRVAINLSNVIGMEERVVGTFKNIKSAAQEGLDGIKYAYENLSDYLEAEFANKVIDVSDSLSQVWGNYYQGLIDDQKAMKDSLDERLEAGLISEEAYSEEIERIDDKIKQLEHDAVVRAKKFNLFEAFVSGANAIVNAWKSLPFPANLVPVALTTAAVGAQIAAIATRPIPAFAAGSDFVVPPGYPDDSFLFRAQSGERVQVTPPGQGADFVVAAPLYLNIDSKPIYRGLLKATKDGIAMVDPRSVRK